MFEPKKLTSTRAIPPSIPPSGPSTLNVIKLEQTNMIQATICLGLSVQPSMPAIRMNPMSFSSDSGTEIDSAAEPAQGASLETCQRAVDMLEKRFDQNLDLLIDRQDLFEREFNRYQHSINDVLFRQIYGYVLDTLCRRHIHSIPSYLCCVLK